MKQVRIRVPATTANLGPGFDLFGMALNLHNEVELGFSETGTRVEVIGEGSEELATDGSNLVLRSAAAVFEAAGSRTTGLHLKAINRIPLARGLGSSSAAIVGGIVAANLLLDRPLSSQRLLELATRIEGHPDNVAPALMGGVVITSAGEDQVQAERFTMDPIGVVVIIPDFHLSTQSARGVLPKSVSFADAVFNSHRVGMMVTGLAKKDWQMVGLNMHDQLHQPYRARLVPGLDEVLAAARESGALGAALSGSGPSVMALTPQGQEEGVAQAMLRVFGAHGIHAQSLLTGLSLAGVEKYDQDGVDAGWIPVL